MSPPVAIGSIDFSASQDETSSKRPLFTIDELIRARAEEMGDAPLLGYPNEGLLDFEEHSAKSCDLYADAAAHKLKKIGLSEVVSLGRPELPIPSTLALIISGRYRTRLSRKRPL